MELAFGNTKGKRVMHKDVYCPEQMFVENNRIANIDICICSPLKTHLHDIQNCTKLVIYV